MLSNPLVGRVQFSVMLSTVSPDAVGAAGVGAAVVVPVALTASELPAFPVFFERTWK